ncbi:MAG: CoA transferase, partial [Deltaproteobacteria bacterium]|nr:CoA transferase [Deltaproteobacteria bacterium]
MGLGQPLAGVRVLDLTRLLPGPFATLLLADLGADVIKVEEPRGGDELRSYQPFAGPMGAIFAGLNRNKRSLALDLKPAEGKRLLEALLGTSDVLVESFRPGVLERLGFAPQRLRAEWPRLVVCSISGYGQSGPATAEAGHDLDYIARAGLLHATGSPDGPPVLPGFQLA